MKATKTMNPLHLAMSIMAISIMTAMMTFKSTMSSWLAFILILTFSSGMMTLFIYAASLTPNEKSKSKKSNTMLTMPVMIMLLIPLPMTKTMKETMKTFSSQTLMMFMAFVLILTMITITSHGYNPQQSISSTF